MKFETVHEMGTEYFVISEACLQEGNHMIEMLRHHDINGILKPILRRIDGEPSFYYEVGGLLTLDEYLRHLNFGKEEIKELFCKFFGISESAREYFIEEYEILFLPESIFFSPDGEAYIPFLPLSGENNYNETGIIKLTERLIGLMDHTNKELIHFIYEVHRRCKTEAIGLSRLHHVILDEKNSMGYRTETKEKQIRKEKMNNREEADIDYRNKEKGSPEKQPANQKDDKRQWLLMVGFLFGGGVITAIVLQSDLLCYEISGRYDRVKVIIFMSVIILAESYAASKVFYEKNI